MKKISLRLIVLVATFFVGLAVVGFYCYGSIPTIAEPELPPVETKSNCIKSQSFPGLSQNISEISKGKSDYFPKRIFGNDMSPKHSVAGWFSKHLKTISEKSLLDVSEPNVEVYRFLWLRTFHRPIFVRVERNRKDIKLFTKELDGAGGYEPGKELRAGSRDLTEKEWCEFLRLLEKANYWKIPTENEVLGLDGAQWILEGVKDNRYHITDRLSPRDGEYREACIFLLKLSGIDIDKLKDDLY